jgi:DNA repair protein RecO (recombination protein O)
VAYGESDVVATFFTRELGTLGAIVRGARRSTKRFGGALEPIHQLAIVFEDRGRELCLLKEARLERPRTRLTTSLEAMEAAGQALRWVRHVCPPRTPEPEAWSSLVGFLDDLDANPDPTTAPGRAAVFGLRLLGDMGYGLELGRCIRCGRPCPEGRPAFLDAAGGGLVCTSCGGARRTVSANLRALASQAQIRGTPVPVLSREEASELVAIVEEAMAAHAGFDPHG